MCGQSNDSDKVRRGHRGPTQSASKTISHSFGFRRGVDLDKVGQLADALEAEAFADSNRRSDRSRTRARVRPGR